MRFIKRFIQSITSFARDLRSNRFDRSLMKYFDWPTFLIVIAISLFGIVTIFSATSTEVTETPATIMEMLETQPLTYARLQFFWLLAGIAAMFFIVVFDYQIWGRHANLLYGFMIFILMLVLAFAAAGRGGMKAFLNWGNDRSFQPSEFGKFIMIIAFAKAFSVRSKPVMTFREIIPLALYMALPMVMVLLQPDFGTALVYLAIFCVMVWVSGTNWKLIAGVIACCVLLVIPIWYFMNNSSSESFRLTRILIWLDPESDPDAARQVINGQIALGSGGWTGKGLVSPGSFASLGYISDDHTDFIFAIVGESFGLVGTCSLLLAYAFLIGRLIYLSVKIRDPFGSYVILAVMSMYLFHIVENICMVIGLLPVTGIPLPFMSYGGSNMVTNMLSLGLVESVVIRCRKKASHKRVKTAKTSRL